jgi:hypothetical protein
MKKFLFVILVFYSSYGLNAQNADNLEPCSSVFSDYQSKSEYFLSIQKILFNGLSAYPYARTLVCQSFQSEYILSIERNDFLNNYQHEFSKVFYLKYRTCKPSIWDNNSAKSKKIILITKEIEVDSTFAFTLEKLYRKALSQVRFQPINTNGDGSAVGLNETNYYFMTKTGYITIACGKTRTPREKTKMYDLKIISELLKSYVLTNDNSIKKEIQFKSEKLIKRFDSIEGLDKSIPADNERIGWISILILLIISNIVLFIKNKRK